MKNETTKFSVSRAILAISNRIKHWALIIFPLCFFFISCNGSKKQSAGQEVNEVKLQTEDILFPVSEVLNLKSYYLSSYFHNDSLSLIYGYNYKFEASSDIANIAFKSGGISCNAFCNRAFYTNSGLYLDL